MHLRGMWYVCVCRYRQKKPDSVKGKGIKKEMSKYRILHIYLCIYIDRYLYKCVYSVCVLK